MIGGEVAAGSAGARDACSVLQESSAPRADEAAIWDTLRFRKPRSLRAVPRQFETSYAI